MRFLLDSVGYCERGDAVNARQLHFALKNILGIDSVLTYGANTPHNNFRVLHSLKQEGIPLFAYSNLEDLHQFAKSGGFTHAYILKAGFYDGQWVRGVKNCVHSVFNVLQPHGDVFAYVSEWLFKAQFSKTTIPWPEDHFRAIQEQSGNPYFPSLSQPIGWVPHIVNPPESKNSVGFRERLGIPRGAKVIGRIGGRTTFDDPAAHEAVKQILAERKDVFAVFVNTNRFYESDRTIYVDEYISEDDKADFFSNCDVTINGRLGGESFGFSVCESLFYGVPCLAPALVRNPCMDAHHVEILSESGLLYEGQADLKVKIQSALDSQADRDSFQAFVKKFSPSHVISQFHSVFIA
jgi:hypothetical protein